MLGLYIRILSSLFREAYDIHMSCLIMYGRYKYISSVINVPTLRISRLKLSFLDYPECLFE
jgi:hypothetical protein